MTKYAPSLPIDIWLLVFAQVDDDLFLWSTCRNVSQFLRDCVDEFFAHRVLPGVLIDLFYSDIHTISGPEYHYVHVPMVFDRLERHGLRAVFQQRAYNKLPRCRMTGSLHGWVPFIERYCEEVHRQRPIIHNKSSSDAGRPLWEQEHEYLRNTLLIGEKDDYLLNVGDMTGIARGDRPPFYIKIWDIVDDTDLVGLTIDCERREISFNWRKTLNLFCRQQLWIGPINDFSAQHRVYDKELDAVASLYMDQDLIFTRSGRARQKRLRPWTVKNKHRMSPEVRLWTARRIDNEKNRLKQYLTHSNLLPLPEDIDDLEERVPQSLAQDHPDLLFWPWIDSDTYFIPPRRSAPAKLTCCSIL
ncbi:hypothetical protein BU24DRAFT_409321 [Aaosphaeria arxii CBS 175.79]|uniref:F-box domain-containing protein n=1 Tax=Aaosphaeria arxii CBS 175.79 TaxID=1450172 RepID=A0A6A5XSM1_9PLEO|nr:uncharacterized protein BU24DRAFT_409321 [Aaosphaeria arxii CBS 175.79]KAF2016182.1 hypothetical protein BU24DRAFT_409321 [Aaosphaeria arxii CBS 175.79]